VLTLPEVADMLGLSPVTVSKRARAGRLPAGRVGKEWRFSRELVEEAVEQGQEAPEAAGPRRPRPMGLFELPEDSMRVPEAADWLRVPVATIYRAVASGRLPAHKDGKEWRLDRRALQDFLSGDPAGEQQRYRKPSLRQRSAGDGDDAS
jgi:excisionase family DNA binding protein